MRSRPEPGWREGSSDTAAFDNALELLVRCGYIWPTPWQ